MHVYLHVNSHVQELMTLNIRRSVYIKEHTFKGMYLSCH